MQSDQKDMKSAVGSVICTVGHKRSAQNSRLRFFNYFSLCNRAFLYQNQSGRFKGTKVDAA